MDGVKLMLSGLRAVRVWVVVAEAAPLELAEEAKLPEHALTPL